MNNKQKIFGIGLPRTGTTSLHNALKLLGIESKNFPFRIYFSIDDPVLSKYNAFIDSPIPFLYRELDKKYPESKFILTTRPLDSWLLSMKWMFEYGSVKWRWSNNVHKYHKEFLGCDSYDREILENKYHKYHEEVVEYFKNREKDILIMDIDINANFQNLCEFLDLPAVNLDYPRSNIRSDVPFMDKIIYMYFIRNVQRVKSLFLKS